MEETCIEFNGTSLQLQHLGYTINTAPWRLCYRRNNNDWFPQLLGWGDQHCIGPQLFGRNERRSHQNAGFSILSFQKFSGGDTPDLHSGRGRPPPALTPSPASARRGAPRCWDPNLGLPQLFSRDCAPGPCMWS